MLKAAKSPGSNQAAPQLLGCSQRPGTHHDADQQCIDRCAGWQPWPKNCRRSAQAIGASSPSLTGSSTLIDTKHQCAVGFRLTCGAWFKCKRRRVRQASLWIKAAVVQVGTAGAERRLVSQVTAELEERGFEMAPRRMHQPETCPEP